jgi:hypothetical protein
MNLGDKRLNNLNSEEDNSVSISEGGDLPGSSAQKNLSLLFTIAG